VKYLHSDIKTIERADIIRDLRLGIFDVLIGINLLREGLDIPEVSLVAITDADKEGFLRSERSLIQTIGRAARNAEGQVILYAEHVTQSMQKAMGETERRRQKQIAYNEEHGIVPKTIKKSIQRGLAEIYGLTTPDYEDGTVATPIGEYVEKPEKIAKDILKLRKKMKKASDALDFEEAARVRDEIKRLEMLDLSLR
jgi:excinuclease ABC subunit B